MADKRTTKGEVQDEEFENALNNPEHLKIGECRDLMTSQGKVKVCRTEKEIEVFTKVDFDEEGEEENEGE